VHLSPLVADGSDPKRFGINVFFTASKSFQSVLILTTVCQHAIDLEVEIRVKLLNFGMPIAHAVSHNPLLVFDIDIATVLFEQQLSTLNFVVKAREVQRSVALEVLYVETDTLSESQSKVLPHCDGVGFKHPETANPHYACKLVV